MSARFDQELGGFVAYQDNGDGTYSPLVATQGTVLTPSFIEAALAPGFALAAILTVPGPGWVEYLYARVDTTTTAGQVTAMWRLFDAGAANRGRLLQLFSPASGPNVTQALACRFFLPAGWTLQLWAQNSDSANRNVHGTALLG